MSNTTSIAPVTAAKYLDIYRSKGPNRRMLLLIAFLMIPAAFIAAAPIRGILPMLMLLAIAVVVLVLWLRTVRRAGVRRNTYNPLKPDDSPARTSINWQEEAGGILLLILIIGGLQFSSVFSSWIFAIFLGLFVGALATWFSFRSVAKPRHYLSPTTLVDQGIFSPPTSNDAWLRVYLHAHVVVPHGFQIHTDALYAELAAEGWQEDELHRALADLERRGDVKLLRELRSADDALHWVTLTEQGRDLVQSRQPE